MRGRPSPTGSPAPRAYAPFSHWADFIAERISDGAGAVVLKIALVDGEFHHRGQEIVGAAIGVDFAGEDEDDFVAALLDDVFHGFEELTFLENHGRFGGFFAVGFEDEEDVSADGGAVESAVAADDERAFAQEGGWLLARCGAEYGAVEVDAGGGSSHATGDVLHFGFGLRLDERGLLAQFQ